MSIFCKNRVTPTFVFHHLIFIFPKEKPAPAAFYFCFGRTTIINFCKL